MWGTLEKNKLRIAHAIVEVSRLRALAKCEENHGDDIVISLEVKLIEALVLNVIAGSNGIPRRNDIPSTFFYKPGFTRIVL